MGQGTMTSYISLTSSIAGSWTDYISLKLRIVNVSVEKIELVSNNLVEMDANPFVTHGEAVA